MISGKGMFVWIIERCEGGDVARIAEVAKDAGLTHVLIKIADGVRSYNQALAGSLCDMLRLKDIEPVGWQYIYGYNPAGEANTAIFRCNELGINHFVVNAEVEYKEAGKGQSAIIYMDRLREQLPDATFALSSYRFPSYHPQLPWREFRDRIHYDMPQVYWIAASNPGAQLIRSFNEFDRMSPKLPYFPTGAAFTEWGWTPTPAQVLEFMQTAEELGFSGCNFWEWSHARRLSPLWKVIADYNWPLPEPPQEEEFDMKECEFVLFNGDTYTDNEDEGERIILPDHLRQARYLNARLVVEGNRVGAWVGFGYGTDPIRRAKLAQHVQNLYVPNDRGGLLRTDGNGHIYMTRDVVGGELRVWLFVDGYV